MAAYSEANKKLGTLLAGADLSQFRFGNIDSTGRIVHAGSGLRVLGVIANDPVENRAVDFTLSGIEQVEAGGVIAKGDLLKSDANGKAVLHTTGTYACAVALSDAVSGDVFAALLSDIWTEA